MARFKLFFGHEERITKIIVGSILCAVFALIFGPGVYASFIGSAGDSGTFEYQYGYGTGYGYGYGYGAGGVTGYGFEGTDGKATTVSVSASQTGATISYTSSYQSKNQVAYGLTTGMTSNSTQTGWQTGSQTISLSSLTCNTTYYYRVASTDAGGNVWYDTATYHTFTTSACSSGGGSTYVPPVITPTTTVATTTATTTVATTTPVTVTPATSPATGLVLSCGDSGVKTKYGSNVAKIYTALKLGSRGVTVKALQQFLNNNGFPVALTGTGSIGKETTLFGSLTKTALIKFQKDRGIKPADGTANVATRAYFKSNYGTYANGSFLRGCDGKIYILRAGKRAHIRSLAELKKYKRVVINNVSNEVLNQYPTQ